jgi:lantibiotic modifying enzyme
VWGGTPTNAEADPTLYAGGAGIVLAMLEAHHHFDDVRWADLATRGARALGAAVDTWDHPSLYFGTTGMAVALHAVAEQLGEQHAEHAARRALAQVRASFDGVRWGPMFELMGGNAGIALGALGCGDIDLAEMAVVPYLRTAEVTPAGATWENRRGLTARRHHIAHGTLGVVYALAATADATGRTDLMDLAMAGVADVVARNEADEAGFLVPHSDPQQAPDLIERYSYGWCHGPTGDAQVFRLLHRLTRDPKWSVLQERCWRTVVASGVPQRIRPGFWDNSGHCCGTAGVLALACDRAVEIDDGLDFATVLVADLTERAVVDSSGARWSNYEHRETNPELEPRQGWAMGNAGIVRELLRYARIIGGRDPSYAQQWPDHPGAGRPHGAQPTVSPGGSRC